MNIFRNDTANFPAFYLCQNFYVISNDSAVISLDIGFISHQLSMKLSGSCSVSEIKGTVASKETKRAAHRISRYEPSEADIKKASEEKKPLAGDLAAIQSLKIPDEREKFEPIILSDTWYEFSVFARKMHLHPSTISKWLDNGWLAFSQIGKIRFINKADVEAMMLRFRRPALMLLGFIVSVLNDLKVSGFFCESIMA